ncbi:MAG: hypothetical protein IKC06_05605 [Clostridia bacterium]|nr:hypothetical protein [Clostridia bacterium]
MLFLLFNDNYNYNYYYSNCNYACNYTDNKTGIAAVFFACCFGVINYGSRFVCGLGFILGGLFGGFFGGLFACFGFGFIGACGGGNKEYYCIVCGGKLFKIITDKGNLPAGRAVRASLFA